MKVFKYDPNYSGRGRSRTAPVQRNKCKTRKRPDNQLKSLENHKVTSPVMFHHVRIDEMNNNTRQDQLSRDSETYRNDGKNQQEPLVIKTDPRYNNSQPDIFVSNKKLHNYSNKKGKKLTFLPSISSRSATTSTTATANRNIGSDNFSNLGIVDFKGSNGIKKYKDEFFGLPNASSPGEAYSHERSHSGPGMGTSNELTNYNRLPDSPVFGRKFSSDVRLKLDKNNSRLQTIEGYSTCTFKVKMDNKNKIESKSYE